MIDQAIPFHRLTAGMAQCVREWILPNLTDSMARIQAEQLIVLLEMLPHATGWESSAVLAEDSAEARALLKQLGEEPACPPARGSLPAVEEENAALKHQLEGLADRWRTGATANPDGLLAVQRYFVASAQRDAVAAAAARSQDFQALTTRDRAGKSA